MLHDNAVLGQRIQLRREQDVLLRVLAHLTTESEYALAEESTTLRRIHEHGCSQKWYSKGWNWSSYNWHTQTWDGQARHSQSWHCH